GLVGEQRTDDADDPFLLEELVDRLRGLRGIAAGVAHRDLELLRVRYLGAEDAGGEEDRLQRLLPVGLEVAGERDDDADRVRVDFLARAGALEDRLRLVGDRAGLELLRERGRELTR